MASTFELLVELSLIIALAKVAGEAAERAGLSAVLGELLVGVALGPTLLGPTLEGLGLHLQNEVIIFLADVGIVLLLLEVGLATDPADIRRVGPRAFVVALIGVAVSFALGTLAMLFLGRSSLAALLMGAALASTSMGISVRVLRDLRRMETPEGRLILASALFDDTMGLVLLSILTGVAVAGALDATRIAWVVILSVAFIAVPLTVGQAIGRALLGLVARGRIRGILTATAFVAALVLAAVAQRIGLAPILGGFAAGLIFAASEKRVHLQEGIKPLADLFVPVFFVWVGSLADLRALGSGGIALLVALLLAVAVVGKMATGLGALGGRARPLRVGIGMIPRGEVSLVVATLATFRLATPVWDVGLYTAVVVVVLLTALLTPPLLRVAFAARGRRTTTAGEPFPLGENVPFEAAPPDSKAK